MVSAGCVLPHVGEIEVLGDEKPPRLLRRAPPLCVRSMEGLGVASDPRKILKLPPRATVARFPVLVPNDQDSNTRFEVSVYDGVRKDPQRKDSAPTRSWCAEARVLDQELGDTLELAEKALCYEWRSLFGVEVQSVSDILFGAGV